MNSNRHWLLGRARMRRQITLRRLVCLFTIAILGGASFGVATSTTNVLGSPYGPFTEVRGEGVGWLQLLSTWLGSMWAWALFPFLVGWIARRPLRAMLAGTSGLLAAVVAYYVCDAVLGMTSSMETNAISLWAQAAALAGPAFALLGAYARGTYFENLLAGLVAPILMVYVVRRGSGSGPGQPWSDRAVLGAAGLLSVALCARFLRNWRSRFRGCP